MDFYDLARKDDYLMQGVDPLHALNLASAPFTELAGSSSNMMSIHAQTYLGRLY